MGAQEGTQPHNPLITHEGTTLTLPLIGPHNPLITHEGSPEAYCSAGVTPRHTRAALRHTAAQGSPLAGTFFSQSPNSSPNPNPNPNGWHLLQPVAELLVRHQPRLRAHHPTHGCPSSTCAPRPSPRPHRGRRTLSVSSCSNARLRLRPVSLTGPCLRREYACVCTPVRPTAAACTS